MKKDEEKVEFDLSKLSLQELVEVYQNIKEFIAFLDGSRIEMEEVGEDDE